MATSIDAIRVAASALIESATPDVEPAITYRPIEGKQRIRDAPTLHSPDATTRTYLVWCGTDSPTFSDFDGSLIHFWTTIVVGIRYHVPSTSPNAWTRLTDLIASDILRITHQLNQVPGWAATTKQNIEAPELDEPEEIAPDLWLVELVYPVLISLAE
jgi:hypothetical protein